MQVEMKEEQVCLSSSTAVRVFADIRIFSPSFQPSENLTKTLNCETYSPRSWQALQRPSFGCCYNFAQAQEPLFSTNTDAEREIQTDQQVPGVEAGFDNPVNWVVRRQRPVVPSWFLRRTVGEEHVVHYAYPALLIGGTWAA